MNWPRGILEWTQGPVGYMSIPFTWNLHEARERTQTHLFIERWLVGGPAVRLMPYVFSGCTNVTIGTEMPGVLQRANPEATRTTTGCPNHCRFCAIGRLRIEGEFEELDDWPDLPVLCDNNLLAASDAHFDKVVARLAKHGWCDFNQGLDARLLTTEHAKKIADIGKPMCRLSLDTPKVESAWLRAVDRLRDAGIPKSRIRTYVLIAFDSGPEEAWQRCEFVMSRGIYPNPQWFHDLKCLQHNQVTTKQAALGWTRADQQHIMGYYYKHRGQKPPAPQQERANHG